MGSDGRHQGVPVPGTFSLFSRSRLLRRFCATAWASRWLWDDRVGAGVGARAGGDFLSDVRTSCLLSWDAPPPPADAVFAAPELALLSALELAETSNSWRNACRDEAAIGVARLLRLSPPVLARSTPPSASDLEAGAGETSWRFPGVSEGLTREMSCEKRQASPSRHKPRFCILTHNIFFFSDLFAADTADEDDEADVVTFFCTMSFAFAFALDSDSERWNGIAACSPISCKKLHLSPFLQTPCRNFPQIDLLDFWAGGTADLSILIIGSENFFSSVLSTETAEATSGRTADIVFKAALISRWNCRRSFDLL